MSDSANGTTAGQQSRGASTSDASLLKRFQAGENDAATQLFLRYATRLRSLAANQTSPELKRRVDPDDVVQSVFRTFFRRAAEGQYEIPAGEELWKLFLVIGLNKVRALGAFHTAAKRNIRLSTNRDEFEEALNVKADSDEQSLQVLQMTIDEMLAPLPESHRDIVNLRIEGFEVAEIAVKVGRSKRSVERILQDFRARMARMIDDCE